VPFLNAFVQNQNGDLFSRIHRHPLIQGYSLPYEVGHAKLVHSDWLRSALIRAVCYCSSVEDFNLERIYLELTCLTNGYSLRFVETHVQHFFNFFHLHPMRYSRDQIMYNKFRHSWFNYIKMQHELSDQLQQFDDKGNNVFDPQKRTALPKLLLDIVLSNLSVFTPINNNYQIDLKSRSASPMLLHNSFELASNTIICKSFSETMSKCSQDQYRKETTTNNEFSVKQDNNDQQQLSSIQSYSSSNDTPTKTSTLTEKEDIIDSQEVQATDDMPPLASLLSCFVRIERCQVDKDIYIPGKNLEGNHELQEQATEKEQHKTTLSVETKGTLSLYDADPYLEDSNSMNNMMIIGSPLSQPLNFDTMEQG
ncbi:unnamed protein product, partial [Rotaria magnacalcarata]